MSPVWWLIQRNQLQCIMKTFFGRKFIRNLMEFCIAQPEDPYLLAVIDQNCLVFILLAWSFRVKGNLNATVEKCKVESLPL